MSWIEGTWFPDMSRCPRCGRFIKRGIFNVSRHTVSECPESEIIVWGTMPDGSKAKMIKRKNHQTNIFYKLKK